MESRRVILLTQGFLRGWLNFNYKNPYSKIREDYILYAIERDILTEILKVKTNSLFSLASGYPGPENIKKVTPTYQELLDFALPYMSTGRKLSKGKDLDTQDWSAFVKAINSDNAEVRNSAKMPS